MAKKYEIGKRFKSDNPKLPELEARSFRPRSLGGEACGDTKELCPFVICIVVGSDPIQIVEITLDEIQRFYEPPTEITKDWLLKHDFMEHNGINMMTRLCGSVIVAIQHNADGSVFGMSVSNLWDIIDKSKHVMINYEPTVSDVVAMIEACLRDSKVNF